MNINESLEADWINIRAILKAQMKRLEGEQHILLPGQSCEAARGEALARARAMITECEKLIAIYAVKV
jgi:hypothetical protein